MNPIPIPKAERALMTGLLMVAHGSRNAEANAEIHRLAHRIAKHAPLVAVAFLEISPPTMDDALAELVAAGAAQIAVLPYFLAAGRHTTRDIPHQINQAKAKHPRIGFEILPHLGACPGMDALILDALPKSCIREGRCGGRARPRCA